MGLRAALALPRRSGIDRAIWFCEEEAEITRELCAQGFELQEPACEQRDCYAYALGKSGFVEPYTIAVMAGILPRTRRSAGNIAWYTTLRGRPVHAGIVVDKRYVVSKWGNGPVFRHRTWDVPLAYGFRLFYTPVPNEEQWADAEERAAECTRLLPYRNS